MWSIVVSGPASADKWPKSIKDLKQRYLGTRTDLHLTVTSGCQSVVSDNEAWILEPCT